MEATQVEPAQFHTAWAAMNLADPPGEARVAVRVVSAKAEPARVRAAMAVAIASFIFKRLFFKGSGDAPKPRILVLSRKTPRDNPLTGLGPELDTD
jgi:hypothetical protein